ncbi:hypothetical protein RFI_14197 [Reticulomyxa filosa]|uniref:Uncharacterized protein n=1 Tax=Reticulomyxa filosa TaxID=46433 RepID=X6NAQ9_RETFI|nr:hypothetical protein RFI_14197 [Reticulomyxa filosa]|eukprot:ETO22988.1 hypothetical protein RFI_14197 [Reticulomyxa filosa]
MSTSVDLGKRLPADPQGVKAFLGSAPSKGRENKGSFTLEAEEEEHKKQTAHKQSKSGNFWNKYSKLFEWFEEVASGGNGFSKTLTNNQWKGVCRKEIEEENYYRVVVVTVETRPTGHQAGFVPRIQDTAQYPISVLRDNFYFVVVVVVVVCPFQGNDQNFDNFFFFFNPPSKFSLFYRSFGQLKRQTQEQMQEQTQEQTYAQFPLQLLTFAKEQDLVLLAHSSKKYNSKQGSHYLLSKQSMLWQRINKSKKKKKKSGHCSQSDITLY